MTDRKDGDKETEWEASGEAGIKSGTFFDSRHHSKQITRRRLDSN